MGNKKPQQAQQKADVVPGATQHGMQRIAQRALERVASRWVAFGVRWSASTALRRLIIASSLSFRPDLRISRRRPRHPCGPWGLVCFSMVSWAINGAHAQPSGSLSVVASVWKFGLGECIFGGAIGDVSYNGPLWMPTSTLNAAHLFGIFGGMGSLCSGASCRVLRSSAISPVLALNQTAGWRLIAAMRLLILPPCSLWFFARIASLPSANRSPSRPGHRLRAIRWAGHQPRW